MHSQAVKLAPLSAADDLPPGGTTKRVISTQLIGIPSGRGGSSNPLNKNQYP